MAKSFWDFSLNTYGSEGVPSACLALQNNLGMDVNTLLFCCWYGMQHGRIGERQFEKILGAAELWAEQVVRPLRHVRSWMKKEVYESLQVPVETVSALREKIKSNELAAEKIQQELLQSLAGDTVEVKQSVEEQLESVIANIQRYFSSSNIVPGPGELAELTHIVNCANEEFTQDGVAGRFATAF